MAIVQGPLLSAKAAGSIAAALTYSGRGRSTTAYALTQPRQPQTQPQIGRRRMFSFLGNQWPLLAPLDQQGWLPKFGEPQPTALLHYMSVNLARWTAHLGPSKANPPTEATTPGAITGLTATAYAGYVKITLKQSSPPNAWAWILYRAPTFPFIPGPLNMVQVWPCVGAGTLVRWDTGVPPGQWAYWIGNCSDDGKLKCWKKTALITVP